jgi:hypothetical protein
MLRPVAPGETDEAARHGGLVRAHAAAEVREAHEPLAPRGHAGGKLLEPGGTA